MPPSAQVSHNLCISLKVILVLVYSKECWRFSTNMVLWVLRRSAQNARTSNAQKEQRTVVCGRSCIHSLILYKANPILRFFVNLEAFKSFSFQIFIANLISLNSAGDMQSGSTG